METTEIHARLSEIAKDNARYGLSDGRVEERARLIKQLHN